MGVLHCECKFLMWHFFCIWSCSHTFGLMRVRMGVRVHMSAHVLSALINFKDAILRPSCFLQCPERVHGGRTWHRFAIFFPPNRLALRTFPSDWTKFLWKATRACGWHKVISRFTVTLKWYATCRTVNSPLPVTDRNWPGWSPAKWVFQLMWARAPKQVTWRRIRISRSSDCLKQ